MNENVSTYAIPTDWKADWIWCKGEPAPFHFFLFARRSFELEEQPKSATLHITACDRYRLFLNGQYLGRGPQRGDPRWQSYDSYVLTNQLQPGSNTIAVQVYHYGCSTGYTRDARAGLAAQLEMVLSSGKQVTICTDPDWRVHPAQGWRRDVRPINGAVGVTEVYDAQKDSPDWMQSQFDDQKWEQGVIIPPSNAPWCRPLPRDIPMLVEQEMFPEEVLQTGESLEVAGEVDIPEILSEEAPEPLKCARVSNPDAVLKDDESFAIVATGRHNDAEKGICVPFILLDFGKQVNGFPRICVEGAANGIVDLTYSEQLIDGRINPIINAARYGDRYVMRDGIQTWETFEYKSFRYLQATFRNLRKPIKVRKISVNTYTYPVPWRGEFECSDPVLTKLWKASVYTTFLCMDDGFMDSPFRERRNWLGDGSHPLLGVYAAFGDIALIRRYFRLAAQGGLGDGMLRMFYPGTDGLVNGTKVVNTITQHAFVWATRVWENYQYFGNRALLEEMYPTLVGLAGWSLRHSNKDGLLENLPYWNWLDWNGADLRGANFGTNAFYLRMLDDMNAIARTLGRNDDAAQWQERAHQVRSKLQMQFWNEQRGLFEDSLYQGKLTGIVSELANALAILYEVADERQSERIVSSLLEPTEKLERVTPLFVYYFLEAFAKVGRLDSVLEIMRQRYGPMMERSDTIWESWAPEAASAHCGGVPAAFVLSTEVIGIKPAGEGFGKCILRPCVELLSSARGVFPSVRGDISLSWEGKEGRTNISIVLPPGLEGALHLPYGDATEQTLTHNNRRSSLAPGIKPPEPLRVQGKYLVLPLSDGKHQVDLKAL